MPGGLPVEVCLGRDRRLVVELCCFHRHELQLHHPGQPIERPGPVVRRGGGRRAGQQPTSKVYIGNAAGEKEPLCHVMAEAGGHRRLPRPIFTEHGDEPTPANSPQQKVHVHLPSEVVLRRSWQMGNIREAAPPRLGIPDAVNSTRGRPLRKGPRPLEYDGVVVRCRDRTVREQDELLPLRACVAHFWTRLDADLRKVEGLADGCSLREAEVQLIREASRGRVGQRCVKIDAYDVRNAGVDKGFARQATVACGHEDELQPLLRIAVPNELLQALDRQGVNPSAPVLEGERLSKAVTAEVEGARPPRELVDQRLLRGIVKDETHVALRVAESIPDGLPVRIQIQQRHRPQRLQRRGGGLRMVLRWGSLSPPRQRLAEQKEHAVGAVGPFGIVVDGRNRHGLHNVIVFGLAILHVGIGVARLVMVVEKPVELLLAVALEVLIRQKLQTLQGIAPQIVAIGIQVQRAHARIVHDAQQDGPYQVGSQARAPEIELH
mmetsp:Transcript_15070/g.57212  ORF Transcript_15070/g.57212 Transcript_15070/m.57212 type:complete len:492 (-) Transcript_15070:6457-7932(-)|eukprot:scaffold253_cov243-Pinguiococcus_pyrenoidosus.AAC.12